MRILLGDGTVERDTDLGQKFCTKISDYCVLPISEVNDMGWLVSLPLRRNNQRA
jgi:hypothetical protein